MHDQSCASLIARQRPRGKRGFTLIELLIVLAIIGVLATLAAGMYRSYVNKAKITVAVGTLDIMRKGLEGFRVDHGDYPAPPIDFTTGLENDGRTVFQQSVINQINDDLFSVDSYLLVGEVYTITAKTKDENRTLMA